MNLKLTFILICASLGLAVLLMGRCRSDEKSGPAATKKSSQNSYIGDQQCKSCHNSQYDDWLKSDHFKAMEIATDSTVLGDFNNVQYAADGVNSTFFRKGEKYFINTQGDDGKNHDYEIKYTFGYFPLQQYLVEFPGGRLQTTRASWDSRKKKWFHQYAGQKIDYRDWLHWTRNAQNWNTMCAECHSTDLKKNYNLATDSYNTTYSSINVSCEACHGPGRQHVDYVNSEDYTNGEKIPNAYILLNKESSQISQINTCAPCHAVKGNISPDKINSNELLDNYIPVVPNTERFYADGQMKEEDYNYAPFLQSKMFKNNVTCSNCHNPHSGRVYFTTNQLCLQCHAKSYDDPSHTFHALNTIGAECKSCHMPSKTYMGNDLRHDHSFRVPRPDLSVEYAVPNACNGCHTDKTAQWATKAMNKWYGAKRKYHFAEDLIPGSKMDAESEAHLIKLLSDTSVPKIIKATAANYLGGVASENSLRHLLSSLKDEDAQVRYEALRSLMDFSPRQYLNDIGPLLNDKVRAVRIAAADLFSAIPRQDIPSAYLSSYTKANTELLNYLLYQADFAHGNISIADYYMKADDPTNAEKFYLRVLKKDSLVNLPRLNLSILYNAQGRNKEALQVLDDAAKVDTKNPQIFYHLGLLYHEMNNPSAAAENFQKAIELKMEDPRLYYNYGLLLQQAGDDKKAVRILETGLKLSPTSAVIHYALTYVYLQMHQMDKARQYAITLKKLDPGNPDYQTLFKTLGVN